LRGYKRVSFSNQLLRCNGFTEIRRHGGETPNTAGGSE
jgi:hypothetical protein